MHLQRIINTAKTMMAHNKGLLAMDESTHTCNKRFAALGIPETVEARRDYRDLIVTTPHLGDFINGVILSDETIRQSTKEGTSFVKIIEHSGIVVGIKVDEGEVDFKGHIGEKVSVGLDGLGERLAEYAKMGARFAKWRGEIIIGNGIPSPECIEENAKSLAQYAVLCQTEGLVPIVEPEVIMDGDHTIERCLEVSRDVFLAVFNQLRLHHVAFEGMILKPNMVLAGLACTGQASIVEVSEFTVNLLLQVVPATVAGIAFLSGGQSYQLATARLNAMNLRFRGKLPWPLTFSYSRGIQQPALECWHGKSKNVAAAQAILIHRAKCNCAARRGEYVDNMELVE